MFRSEDEAAGYLAGIIDGEGHVANRGSARFVQITNTDPPLLDAAEAACDVLGIGYRRRLRTDKRESHLGEKPVWETYISRQEHLIRLRECVTLRVPYKEQALTDALAAYRPEPPIEEALALLGQGLTLRAVAERLDVPYSTVQSWSAKQGAKRPSGRPKGSGWSPEERKRRENARGRKPHQPVPVTREEFERLYAEEGGLRGVASRLGIGYTTALSWRDELGIAPQPKGRRPRGAEAVVAPPS